KGARPTITSAPASVGYGDTFEIVTPQASEIGKVTWVRLSSVTHAFNLNQRITFLPFDVVAGKLQVTAPASANACPPGHYLLFILSKEGVPSVAKIVQIQAAAVPAAPAVVAPEAAVARPSVEVPEREAYQYQDAFARRDAVLGAAKGAQVVAGI